MGIKKLFGEIYYADYRDTRGIRRRISLETTNLAIAQKKYADCKLYKVEGANHCYDDHLDEMFNAVVSFLTQVQT